MKGRGSSPALQPTPDSATSSSPHPGPEQLAAVADIPLTTDDSTLHRMVALLQSQPRTAEAASAIATMHENFVLTPDDPEWSRRAERALRDFFQAQVAHGSLQITSVSCRSAGCEVQALGERIDFKEVPAAEAELKMPPALSVRTLLDRTLIKQRHVVLDLGDRAGYIVTYTREPPTLAEGSP